ncbi:MAG TPA: aminotransferase class I/II-fold pyridoxal phosphate-dependent enzyme, partial [Aggregatilineales bacterium]|nr:aminotransferase class I/II-fold pyridoxal phosphate-dependent enzyme [Aggregatilineales bacterium]
LVAGIAALQDQEHLQKNVKASLDSKREVCNALDACAVKYWHSETNFLAIDVGRPDQEVAEALLYHGVMVRPLTTNSMPGCIRVSMSVPEGNRKFVEGLIAVLGLK